MTPLFLGPSTYLVGVLLLIVLVLVIARVVIGLAWMLVVISAIVLLVLWLVGAIGTGGLGITPPGLG
ncbi:MAG: hypothetical protein ACQETB_01090 [Halobacteriota archaeon]